MFSLFSRAVSLVDGGSAEVSLDALTSHPDYVPPSENPALDPEVKTHLAVRGPVFALGARLMPLWALRKVYDAGGLLDSRLIASKLTPLTETDVILPINGDGEPTPLRGRLYSPRLAHMRGDETPLVFYVHGGGYSIGSLASHASTCRFLASATNFRVLAVTYRLAPEARHPAQIKDCLAWYRHVAIEKPADFGLSPTCPQIVVSGDSAGGQLTISLGLHIRDNNRRSLSTETTAASPSSHIPAPVMLAPLYPVINRFREWRSSHRFGEGYELSLFLTEGFSKYYLGPTPEERNKWRGDQYLHPDLQLDLSGLPPTLLVTAECDLLHDEGVAFFRAVRERGGVGTKTPTSASAGAATQSRTPGFSTRTNNNTNNTISSGSGGAGSMPAFDFEGVEGDADQEDGSTGSTQIAHIEAKGLLHGFCTHVGAYRAAEKVMREVASRIAAVVVAAGVVEEAAASSRKNIENAKAIKRALHHGFGDTNENGDEE